MADITLTYNSATIAELSASGTKTIKTGGKYCEGDITLTYAKPLQGGIKVNGRQNNTITISKDGTIIASYTLATGEYYHIFPNIDYGIYTVEASQTRYGSRSISVTHADYLTECTCKASPLPSGYTELTYIQSALNNTTNGSYIDTGIVPDGNTTWQTKFMITNTSGWAGIIGCREKSGGWRYWNIYQGSGFEVGINGDLSSKMLTNKDYIQQLKQVVTSGDNWHFQGYYINGEGTEWSTDVNRSSAPPTAGALGTLSLFAVRYTAEGNTQMPAHGLKMYECMIWQNDQLVREFIPCIQTSNDEVGMFDTVNSQFYGSSGSLVFLPGDPV